MIYKKIINDLCRRAMFISAIVFIYPFLMIWFNGTEYLFEKPMSYQEFVNKTVITETEEQTDINIKLVKTMIQENGNIKYVYNLDEYYEEDIILDEPIFEEKNILNTIEATVIHQQVKFPISVTSNYFSGVSIENKKSTQYFSSVRFQSEDFKILEDPLDSQEISEVVKDEYERYKKAFLDLKEVTTSQVYMIICTMLIFIISLVIYIKSFDMENSFT